MAEGLDHRAEMDLETFRALLWLNGGGALAVLTFLSTIINAEGGKYLPLAEPLLHGVLGFTAGLLFAVFHNMARRECSRIFQLASYRLERTPPICRLAVMLRLLSIACFGGSIVYMAFRAIEFF